ncbi:MAG TPA: AgmX/PglI C-terminal domain-containing protein [Minicystis sp.]|nr:AgmX/PglI C-terminal domain-containing protein [Minicystis sp.]
MAENEQGTRRRKVLVVSAARGAGAEPGDIDMKRIDHVLAPLAAVLSVAALVGGCVAGAADEGPSDSDDAVRAPAAQAATPTAVASRLQQAERKVDVGSGAEAVDELAALRADPSASPEQRDQATFAYARALEAKGDEAGATRTLEELVARHGWERNWSLQDAAERELRRLVTGHEEAPRGYPARADDEPVAPFAHALTKYFAEKDHRIEVHLYGFGGDSATSDKLGTFNVARAIRTEREDACPLCAVDLNISTHSSRTDDWLGILKAGADRERALVVYYDSLGSRRIPARFDAELPMPSADVEARLARGEGVVAAKERPGAPPAILIAAPRDAELAEVEAALAQMKSVPLEPVSVPLSDGLRPSEVREIVRGSRKDQRACYAALLERRPDAQGTLTLKLAVLPDGSVDDASSEATAGVRDADFARCMEDAAKKLVFPATHGRGNVTFPVRLAPAK